MLSLCPVSCLSLEKLNVRKQQTKISIGPILFLYHEESLVSSNLDSKQLKFHGAHPNVYGKKNLKEQLSDVLEIKIQLLNLIYIFAEEVSVNVYHAHNRINF